MQLRTGFRQCKVSTLAGWLTGWLAGWLVRHTAVVL
jgi:hypothetical protein